MSALGGLLPQFHQDAGDVIPHWKLRLRWREPHTGTPHQPDETQSGRSSKSGLPLLKARHDGQLQRTSCQNRHAHQGLVSPDATKKPGQWLAIITRPSGRAMWESFVSTIGQSHTSSCVTASALKTAAHPMNGLRALGSAPPNQPFPSSGIDGEAGAAIFGVPRQPELWRRTSSSPAATT